MATPHDQPEHPLAWQLTPEALLRRWPRERRLVMLHSGRTDPRWATQTLLAEPVGAYRFLAQPEQTVGRAGGDHQAMAFPNAGAPRGRSEWIGPERWKPSDRFTHDPFDDLRQLLTHDAMWVGYLSYDLGRWVETLPNLAAADRDWPIIELACCPWWLRYDLQTRRWSLGGDADAADLPGLASIAGQSLEADLSKADRLGDEGPGMNQGSHRHNLEPWSFEAQPHAAVEAGDRAAAGEGDGPGREHHESAVAKCLDYIAAGDIFQVNLAQRFTARFAGVAPLAQRAFFQQLATVSPAWYGAYLELSHESHGFEPRRTLASTSPELFLAVDDRGHVVTRPIKGTRPGDADPAMLADSIKDAAELNMIVDLMRNDLGRVCRFGSVRVAAARDIESHPTVHHGVATIVGELREKRDTVDLLRAVMPAGSVTGAPKVRAMEIIDALEPARRGPYCGAIGYLHGKACQLSVGIRTAMIETAPRIVPGMPGANRWNDGEETGRVDYWVGGGIVADSEPAAEYQETLDKAAAISRALGSATSASGA